MYTLVLTLHAWLRWLVLLAAAALFARAVMAKSTGLAASGLDKRLLTSFVGMLDLQLLLGLSLYLSLSPIVAAARANMKAAMHSPVLRFFVVEHLTSMLLALVAAHVTSVMAKKAPDDHARRRRVLWGVGIALVCLIVGVPWPGLPYARPLFRV